LKNKDFKGAELDCNKCIELDSSQIKAWFRRGLARKALKKYNKSLQDFQTVLNLDPNNKAAKKEKIEMKNKLQSMLKKSKEQTFGNNRNLKKTEMNKENKDNKMRRIVIEECDDSDSDSDSSSDQRDDVKYNGIQNEIKEISIKKKESQNNVNIKDTMLELEKFEMDKIPTNFIEFEKIWRRAKITKNRSLVLLALKNKRIDKIIKNMIDDTLFSEMIETVHYIAIQIDIKDGLLLLKQLTKLDRFEMIVMFMNEIDQKLLKEIKQKCVDNQLNISVFDKFE